MVSIEKIGESLRSHPFTPPKFLQNYNIQTLFAKFIPHFKITMPKKERKYINLIDGSRIAADCFFQPHKSKHPTIIILNGLAESSDSFFSRSMGYKAYSFGFNVILLMQRAEGNTVHLTNSLYTVYPQFDLPIVLEEFSKIGNKGMYLVGISYGGWASLLTVATMGKKAKQYLTGVISLSAPVNILSVWDHIENYPLYNRLLLHFYKKTVKNRAKVDPVGTWDMKQLRKIKTKMQFFETYLSTHTVGSPKKRQTIADFQKSSNVIPRFPQIHIPTLIIHSYDDPFIPITPFLHLTNPFVITLLTRYGGHGGFFTLKPMYGDLDSHWAQNRTMEFINLLEDSEK